MKYTLLLVLLILNGCAAISIHNVEGEKRTITRVYVPAWPWQDSQQIVDRMTIASKTNGIFNLSLRASENEQTNTNLVGIVVGAAVSSAVKAVKP